MLKPNKFRRHGIKWNKPGSRVRKRGWKKRRNSKTKWLGMLVLWSFLLGAGSFLLSGMIVNKGELAVGSRSAESMPSVSSIGSPTVSNPALNPVSKLSEAETDSSSHHESEPWVVPVYRSQSDQIENLPLEYYVRGVLAAEMPAEFHLEALKAQAIAARTYIVNSLWDHFNHGALPGKAWVTDTVMDQVYFSIEDMKERWGQDFEQNWLKLTEAVEQTRGKIVIFEQQPILAAFFSTSNGYTENSEDYWAHSMPYLRSVASPWDQSNSSRYRKTHRFTPKEAAKKLGVSESAASGKENGGFRILSRTEGQRVAEAAIGSHIFTGREIREKLGLPSSHFDIQFVAGEWVVTTYGYGHGVGMSQYGANGMAGEGKTAEEILLYYYQGVELGDLWDYVDNP